MSSRERRINRQHSGARMDRRVFLVAGRPSGLSPQAGAVDNFVPGKQINRQRQTSVLVAALGRSVARPAFSTIREAVPFFPRPVIQPPFPSFFRVLKGTGPFFPWQLLLFPPRERLLLSLQLAKRSEAARRSARPEGPSLSLSVLSPVVLCGIAERIEYRCVVPHSGHKLRQKKRPPLLGPLPRLGGEDALQLRGNVGPHKGIGGGPTRGTHDLAPVPDLSQSVQRAIQGTLPLSGHPID
jgi:hypothetical protein